MFLVVCLQLLTGEYGAAQIVLQVVLSMEEDIIVFFKGGYLFSASISFLVYKIGGFLDERS